jgi:hypothetical protein
MQLSRQQKRAMLRRLNDKAKMTEVMNRIEKSQSITDDTLLKKRSKVLYTVLQWVLIASIVTWFVFS